MVDSLLDLDSSPIFRLAIDYNENPKSKFTILRDVLEFEATIKTLVLYDSSRPRKFTFKYTSTSHQDLYELLTFFEQQKGQYRKFWFIDVQFAFTLVSQVVNSTDISLKTEINSFADIYTGKEILAIVLQDGSIITRKITGVNIDEVLKEYTVGLNSQVGQTFNVSTIFGVYLILPCRLDTSSLNVNYLNGNGVAETNFDIVTLLKEYP